MNTETVLRQFPVDNTPGQLLPWTIPTQDIYPPGKLTPGQSPPRKFSPGQLSLEQQPLGQFPSRTNAPLDNSHLELLYCPSPDPPDNYTPTITAQSNNNYKLQFFHGYFLYLFHGPIRGHLKSTFSQDSGLLTSHSPLVCPCSFSSPHGTFVLTRTHFLPSPSISILVKFRVKLNNEYQYLWLNSTWFLRTHSGISIKRTPLVQDKSVRFMEMPALQRVQLKIRSLQKQT